MESVVIEAKRRSCYGSPSARQLRRSGKIPAVLYGRKDENVSVAIDPKVLRASLDNGVYMVTIDVEGKSETALIKAVQYDNLNEHIIHADFARVAMDETVQLAVPVETIGTPKGERSGGVMDIVMKEITIECLPGDIPNAINVKVMDLDITDRVQVSDLEVPDNVKIIEEPSATVIVIHPPTVHVEVVEEEEEAPTEPEVITEKKEEETPEGEE